MTKTNDIYAENPFDLKISQSQMRSSTISDANILLRWEKGTKNREEFVIVKGKIEDFC